MGRSSDQEVRLSGVRKYRKFTAKQKVELVLASFRGDRSIAEICREHRISEALLRRWRDQMIAAAAERFEQGQDRSVASEQRQRIRELERALGRKTYELEGAGKHCEAGSERARRPVSRAGGARRKARGRGAGAAGLSPGDLPRPGPAAAGGQAPLGAAGGRSEQAIVEVAEANQTDGYRMVTAMVARKLGRAINRKRVLRVMRERRLIQRRRRLDRRRRPGFLRVTRPNELWQLDLTSVWVAEHGWCYSMAAIDCCTREIVGWHLELRCRAQGSIALIQQAACSRAITPGMLTLGSDNGSAFTARAFKLALSALGIAHRRGGYRDPESQAFIESWFAKLKERCVWLHEFETLDQAREVIAAYIESYHHRPHSGLDYRTPTEVAQTWDDALGELQTQAA